MSNEEERDFSAKALATAIMNAIKDRKLRLNPEFEIVDKSKGLTKGKKDAL